MRDQICDVISYCASTFAIGKMKCILSNRNYKRETEKRWMSNKFYTNFNPKR